MKPPPQPQAAFVIAILTIAPALAIQWAQDVMPKIVIKYGEEGSLRFAGNESHKDHFKLLQQDGSSLLVGARNIVYNISLKDLTEFEDRRIVWFATAPQKEMCSLKGKSEDDCQNFIRVLAKIKEDELLICGTCAYSPLCRIYKHKNNQYVSHEQTTGIARCPHDPDHNSTAVYTDGKLYSATIADFSGGDPLIYREPLRTERSDLKQLNAPNFVSSLPDKDHVFFFFRETAVEYINCGKSVYSRVARVCKRDKGGPHQFSDRWTSFLKSRLNCSAPGDYPFYFNEIQSMSGIVEGTYLGGRRERLLYGVFTTPVNSIGGSAICVFSMNAISATFDGPYKEQETMNSNWLPVPSLRVPDPRPGTCVNDSRTLPELAVNFAKSHTLMDEAVPAFFSKPLLIRVSLDFRFTVIAVDEQVLSIEGKTYDVLYIGTDDGKVMKALNAAAPDNDTVDTVLIDETQVLPLGIPIKNLHVVHLDDPADDKLVVLTDDEIQSVPLHRCGHRSVQSCRSCVGLRDPHCAWDTVDQKCVARPGSGWARNRYLQNIASGVHRACPAAAFDDRILDPAIDGKELKQVSSNEVLQETHCPACPVCPVQPMACPSIATVIETTTETTTIKGPGGPGAYIPPAYHPSSSSTSNDGYGVGHGGGHSVGHGGGHGSGHGNSHGAGLHNADINESESSNQIVIEVDENNIIPDTMAKTNKAGSTLEPERVAVYSVQTLGVAVATAALAALVVGFIAGFIVSRRCRPDDYPDMPFPDHRHQLNRLTEPSLNADSSAYLPPCANNKAAINLVLNVPPKNANGKNANSSAENKPIQKVKKTYI